MSVTIDIVSDVVCPWCYVGKRRLERALGSMELESAPKIIWRPFQLNPGMPREGMDRKTQRVAKFGSWEAALDRDAMVAQAGAADGIPFAFDKILRTPNTFDSHRLLWFADRSGLQDELAEALFAAFFVEGMDIGQTEVLVEVACATGLDRKTVTDFLEGNGGVAEVEEEEAHFKNLGINAVPFFIINGRHALSGAQPPGVIAAAIERAVSD
jgi:predicted DsbA family dithiol-disulfide isomerase